MTLPASGVITMSMINEELSLPFNTPNSLNNLAVRNLAGIPEGAISISNLYGKSSYVPPVENIEWREPSNANMIIWYETAGYWWDGVEVISNLDVWSDQITGVKRTASDGRIFIGGQQIEDIIFGILTFPIGLVTYSKRKDNP